MAHILKMQNTCKGIVLRGRKSCEKIGKISLIYKTKTSPFCSRMRFFKLIFATVVGTMALVHLELKCR